MHRATRIALRALTAAALSSVAWIAAPSADAQRANPWTLGIVDASFIWSPPASVPERIPKCAYELAKQAGYTAATASRDEESPLQHCLVRAMHEHGATENAIAFSHWYYETPQGDSAFMTALVTKPRFGPVQVASIEYVGRANNTAGLLFVNGTNPQVTNPAVVFAPTAEPWKQNGAFQAIQSAHHHAMVYPALSYVSLAKRDGGGQRFILATPILDGCHACAQIGVVYIAYDFGNLGAPKSASVSAVHRCPSSDTRCAKPE